MDESLESKFAALKSKNLKIDLTRGKPGSDQLDLSNDLLSMTVPAESESGVDVRNYGDPLGIPEARKLGGELLSAPIDNTLGWRAIQFASYLSAHSCKPSFWFREAMERAKKFEIHLSRPRF